FDGDQMAVHLPLSPEAQAEARILMLSANNILKPSDGKPVTMPSQDMIIGLYHLTSERKGLAGEGRSFSSLGEAIMAFDHGELDLGSVVTIRLENVVPGADLEVPEGWEPGMPLDVTTTLGRALFNEYLPADYTFVNSTIDKKALSRIVNHLAEEYPKVEVAHTLDNFKSGGFHWATRSGITVAMSDIVSPEAKTEILDNAEALDTKVQQQYELGALTDDERRNELVKLWTETTEKVDQVMRTNFPEENSVLRLVDSGASGNWMQVRQ
ncbi:DNA-directed RNA polymerase subunit beta', partial [Burkholderia multivorans]